ncbi:unnamed protein product (macronuclear) [Paramecium tetraurelia]|uniref:Protein kinase domain-containing protein n=1 Tax=Paramecium tetraurelia TaxID=5888 RepID=A0DDN9_PARTE|nr:uncharacterized protein GSPATT00015997001 [Paramecium tetraurelia]CAK81156.1 unnamed protein product [Paramecium tetraurelia]|eukprot:XP_001448553.1 hypothetical protein (macronuclear) [Paramecium tetraurelia strain d4-2]
MNEEQQIFHLILGNESNLDKSIQKSNAKIRVEELRQHLASKYSNTYVYVLEDIKTESFNLNFLLETHGGIFKYLMELIINFQEQSLDFKVYFSDDNGRIIVNQKVNSTIQFQLLRLQVSRYTLRLNSSLHVGSFFINPVYGEIGLNLATINTRKSEFFDSAQPIQDDFIVYMDSLILTAIYSIRYHYLRILFMINKINLKLFKLYEYYYEQVRYKDNQQLNWRKFPKDSEQLLLRIKKVVKNQMHLQFTEQEYLKLGPILSKQISTENSCLIEVVPKNQSELEVDERLQINEGGFCNIYSKEIIFAIKKEARQQQQGQKRTLVIKMNKGMGSDKIKQEAEIIQVLSNQGPNIQRENQPHYLQKYFQFSGCCPYIAQFYSVSDRPDVLLMERYYHSSLDYLKSKKSEVLSLSSRIFISHNVAMGLRYIHNYGIIHMDIKPANILISKTMMAKITDFGEAINTNNISDSNKPGKTIPFCAPEIQQRLENNQYTYAYDIYSLGVLIFELLFDRFPIVRLITIFQDFRKQNYKCLEDKLQKQIYQVRYNEDEDQKIGPQYLMKYLGRLCIQCLQPDPQLRPNIDKIILVLKDCLTFLDKVY